MTDVIETKTCRKCLAEKMVQDFSLDSTRADGRAVYCKLCYARQVRSQRMKMYGVSVEQVERVLAKQGGICACCRETPVTLEPGKRHDRTTMSFVDYRHGWGFPAGILCHLCIPRVNITKSSVPIVEYLRDSTLEFAS